MTPFCSSLLTHLIFFTRACKPFKARAITQDIMTVSFIPGPFGQVVTCPETREHIKHILQECDDPTSHYHQLQVAYNNQSHYPGLRFAPQDPASFTNTLASIARSQDDYIYVQGTPHLSLAHYSHVTNTFCQDTHLTFCVSCIKNELKPEYSYHFLLTNPVSCNVSHN